MKIRTQLIVAFLLLAVVPLTVIVLYSYFTSIRAVRHAMKAEAGGLTSEMETRMSAIKEDLDRRLARVGSLPLGTLMRDPGSMSSEEAPLLFRRLVAEIGEAAPFVESFMLMPAGAPPAEAPPAGAPPAGAPPEPAPPEPPRPPGYRRPPIPAAPVAPRTENGVEVEIVEVPGVSEAPLVISEDPEIKPLVIDFPALVEGVEKGNWRDIDWGETDFEAEDEVTIRQEDAVPFQDRLMELGGVLAGGVLAEIGVFAAEAADLGLEEAAKALEEEEVKAAAAGDEERLRQLRESRLELERKRQSLALRAAGRERARELAALRAEHRRSFEERHREMKRLLGRDFGVEIRDQGEPVGEIRAQISTEMLLRKVLHSTPRDHGEVPFALAEDGGLYPADEDDLPLLESLELERDAASGRVRSRREPEDWMIVSLADDESGLAFGVARPIGDSLAEIRRTTARNLGFGLGLIGLALLGILPLSRRITSGLETVTEGANRVARGDFSTRVPVASRSEVGQLASAFNHMAGQVQEHQRKLVEEEGRRKEQELEKRFLEVEFQRKSRELEDAREFQLSLLPKTLPEHPAFELAVDMQTATEVGGDYYDFHLADDGTLTLAVGDATGHGARAGTMVTVVKSLFSAISSGAPLAGFLQQAARTVRRMDLGRMAMALTVARLEGGVLTLSAAGMPPALVYRAGSGEVEELALAGMPLGGLASEYEEKRAELGAGDHVLLLSDGLPELADAAGEPLGYSRVRSLFAAAAAERGAPADVIAALTDAAADWTKGQPPSDDMTFVVVEKKAAA